MKIGTGGRRFHVPPQLAHVALRLCGVRCSAPRTRSTRPLCPAAASKTADPCPPRARSEIRVVKTTPAAAMRALQAPTARVAARSSCPAALSGRSAARRAPVAPRSRPAAFGRGSLRVQALGFDFGDARGEPPRELARAALRATPHPTARQLATRRRSFFLHLQIQLHTLACWCRRRHAAGRQISALLAAHPRPNCKHAPQTSSTPLGFRLIT